LLLHATVVIVVLVLSLVEASAGWAFALRAQW
jgi:hypothetical protein